MKKLWSFALMLLILLSACATPPPAASPSPIPTPTATATPTPTPAASAVPTLGFSKEAYITAVDTYLKNQNYTTISSVTPNTPESDEAGINAYAYEMAPGFLLILSEDAASKNLTQIFITADKSKIGYSDMVWYGVTCFASIYQMEKDGAESIIATLNMTSDSPDPVNIASSALYSYSYMIDDSLTMFQVLPA